MTSELRTFYDNFNYIQSRRQLVSCTPTCMNKARSILDVNVLLNTLKTTCLNVFMCYSRGESREGDPRLFPTIRNHLS